ncbi:hypothetical protein BDV33DRAFT_197221 [Aspergillus novoparasiticus]|uniref:F-box domain-containing protein n=1 Tax=Aspergillus novoparasiticus TaxID=986946 RepID=A0A5N6E5H9_9EURO|nr:hypothetical protein BDV33DRAFT_197221 [Aspergillus novoparasiticus]
MEEIHHIDELGIDWDLDSDDDRHCYNLLLNGKWYSSYSPPLSDEDRVGMGSRALSVIRHAQKERSPIGWDPVDGPRLPDSNVGYWYTINLDAGHFTQHEWQREPSVDRFPLAAIHDAYDIKLGWSFKDGPVDFYSYQMISDFIYQWRFVIDDPARWPASSLGFRRLRSSTPDWDYMKDDIFWFHGFLVVQCWRLDRTGPVEKAIQKAQDFPSPHYHGPARVILTSLRHVAFVEISQGCSSCSAVLPLITSTIRASVQVLSTPSWKSSQSEKEHWGFYLPPDIVEMILQHLGPKDLAAFCRASYVAERLYYSTIPQLCGVNVSPGALICPSCFQKELYQDLVCCVSCFEWHPAKCECHGRPFGDYKCVNCKNNGVHPTLAARRIEQRSKVLQRGTECKVIVNGRHMMFALRIDPTPRGRPTSVVTRQGERTLRPRIQYTIQFGGVFSGLAYGLEEMLYSLERKERYVYV